MEKVHQFWIVGFIGCCLLTIGCMDRDPAPMCPVPTEVNQSNFHAGGFVGVDLLVVVDNSRSMAQEQSILATGFFTLINSLINPEGGTEWENSPIENMRVAIVSSDMGLQYGENGNTDGNRTVVNCSPKGDNGRFQNDMPGVIKIDRDVISCEKSTDHCPPEWNCSDDGKCVPNTEGAGATTVSCKKNNSGDLWAETGKEDINPDLARQVACMGMLGTGGCGIEQQLEASVLALSRKGQQSFMKDDHLLAVLIVSDEEDCSIMDKGLFETEEWPEKVPKNTVCSLPKKNEDFLFDTKRYRSKFIEIKNGDSNAVIFAAIVGVPRDKEAGCQGRGGEIADCLDHPKMQMKEKKYEEDGMTHFAAACERYTQTENGEDRELVTRAYPGRRYVEVAKGFGSNGYVYSICNPNWSDAMSDIAKVIAQNITNTCYSKPLEWNMLSKKEQTVAKCDQCGIAKCEVIAEFDGRFFKDLKCPLEFNISPDEANEPKIEMYSDGTVKSEHISCLLPKLPAPLDCTEAEAMYRDSNKVGWYYCEDNGEDFEDACNDEIDNDGDGNSDCEQESCKACKKCRAECPDCELPDTPCRDSCKWGVELTPKAKPLVQGGLVKVECLQEFSFEDSNCQENSLDSCIDHEDNDGNGVFDCYACNKDGNDSPYCKDDIAHRPDKNCCPMEIDPETRKCLINRKEVLSICPNPTDGNLPDACYEHKRLLGCEW